MRVPLTAVSSTPDLPSSADVVVIGGGIVGVFAAYYLAQRGQKVALVEKGQIGAEQSSRNWGWCRQQNRDARELPIATQSLDLWDRFARDSGEDTGFKRCGLLYLSNDEAELARWTAWRDFARTVGVETHMLTGDEATERGHATGRNWKGGVFSPTDGTANPGEAAPAVARAIIKLGGTVHQRCAARGIETEGGRLSGVVTEHGTIRTRRAVLAGGAWASSFCRQLGIRFPQATIRSSIVALSSTSQELPPALHTAKLSATRRSKDLYSLAISGLGSVDVTPQQIRFAPQFLPMFLKRWRSLAPGGAEGLRSGHETLKRWRLDAPTPMERMRVLDPRPDARTIKRIQERAIDLLPALRGAPIANSWGAYIDCTPDGLPGIGEAVEVPGLMLAAGFTGHGFGIGPGAGHLVADLISGDEPIVDPAPYDPERFKKSAWGQVADF